MEKLIDMWSAVLIFCHPDKKKTMQGNCCRDLDVVLRGGVSEENGHLLQYAGRYNPQPGETTAKGKKTD